jgi:hypothetical protein
VYYLELDWVLGRRAPILHHLPGVSAGARIASLAWGSRRVVLLMPGRAGVGLIDARIFFSGILPLLPDAMLLYQFNAGTYSSLIHA